MENNHQNEVVVQLNKDLSKITGADIVTFNDDDKFDLEVGVNYQGSFRINVDGSIKVRPYKMGSKPQNLKKIFDSDFSAILESRKILRVVFTFSKDSQKIIENYKESFLETYKFLHEHKYGNNT